MINPEAPYPSPRANGLRSQVSIPAECLGHAVTEQNHGESLADTTTCDLDDTLHFSPFASGFCRHSLRQVHRNLAVIDVAAAALYIPNYPKEKADEQIAF